MRYHRLFVLVPILSLAFLIGLLTSLATGAQGSASSPGRADLQTPALAEAVSAPVAAISPSEWRPAAWPARPPLDRPGGQDRPSPGVREPARLPASRPTAAVLDADQLLDRPTTGSGAYLPAQAPGRLAEKSPLGPLSTPPLPGSADLALCVDTDRVWGIVGAGDTATVTVNGAQLGAARADERGFFWTTLYDAGGSRPNLDAGDTVAIYDNGALAASLSLRAISGTVDVVNDVVSGTIGDVTSPISVTVYVPWGEPTLTAYSQTVSTDASGRFSADFSGVWELTSEDAGAVAYVENGVEVHRHVYPASSLLVRAPWRLVRGFTAPGTNVTVTLYLADGVTVKETAVATADGTGWFRTSLVTDVLETEIVAAELADGTVMSRTVDRLTEVMDAANDRVTGEARPGDVVIGYADELTPLGWRSVWVTTTATASGAYTLDFGGLANLLPGRWVGVYVPDAQGDDLNLWHSAPSVEVDQTKNEVSGTGVWGPGPWSPRRVTLTLSSTSDAYSKQMGWAGSYKFSQDDGLPDIAPGDVLTVESEGSAWQGVVRVQTMAAQYDLAADRFTGAVVTPTSRVELGGAYWQSQLYPVGGSFEMLVTATSPFTGSPSGFDVRPGVGYQVGHRTADEYLERIGGDTDNFGVSVSGNGVWAWLAPPGAAFTVTLYNGGGGLKAQLTGTLAGPAGFGHQSFWDAGQQVEAGDRVQVRSAAGFSQTLVVPGFTIRPDAAADVVTGQAPANALLLVNVDGEGQGFVPADGSGRFAFEVSQLQEVWGDGDLEWGDNIGVEYWDENWNWVYDQFFWPHITARSAMDGGNTVLGGNAFPGNTIYITVTDSGASVVATGTTTAGACPWGGPRYYCLDMPGGTLVPSHTVTVNFGGYVDSVHVVTLTGAANPDTDLVTGVAPAGGQVHAWGQRMDGSEQSPDILVQVEASGVYTLDFGSQGWDVRYGDSYHVYCGAPHGHEVEYWFWLPAPELQVPKWNTSGHTRPGGRYVYGIYYGNEGTGVATNTLIVDTLPASTTYAGDTSGITPAIGANGVITWAVGDLAPGDYGVFMVTVNVSDTVPTGTGALSPNCIAITTATPGDYRPENDAYCTDRVDVWEADWDVNVDKWPNPGDPTPGQEFEYTVRWCSDRGAASGPAWLTDTLPVSTTLLSWRPQNWWERFWTEVVTTGGKLVLYAPGLPGDMCQHLAVRLLLDPNAPISTTLSNTVVITTPGDIEPGNNGRTNTDAHVSPPRYDMRLDKHRNSGALAPGGWADYNVHYRNQGNSAVHVRITDTLPAGTTYRPGSTREPGGGPPFSPALVADGYVVWDLGLIEVGQDYSLDFTVDISPTLTPPAVLTNCATVGITVTESTPADNTDCVADTVYAPGPNLRVSKWHEWRGNNDRLYYEISFENMGSQVVYNARLTDTYPLSTTLQPGSVGWDGWVPDVTQSHNPADRQLIWQFQRLDPGWSARAWFEVSLDDPNARPRWYTNTVEIAPLAGDVYTANNADTDVAVKPEVEQVELWIEGESSNVWGRAQPNAPVTVTAASAQTVTWSDEWGNWNTNNGAGPIQPGDVITVEAGSGRLPVVVHVPNPFSAQMNSTAGIVFGQIGGWTDQIIEVHGGWFGGYRETTTDASGYYTATYGAVPRGASGYVRYVTQANYAQLVFHRPFRSPDLVLRVTYGEWVGSDYEAGHTVWLTVTDSASVVKATAVLSTVPGGGWGGNPGFSTDGSSWSPRRPDIAPGDWVHGRVDNGYAASVRIGTITGTVDSNSDSVSGRIYAAWFTRTLDVECHPWGGPPDTPGKRSTAGPGGDPPYFCRWNPVTEWNVQPGQDVGVWYIGSDANWVGAGFREPAADVAVDKYGQARPAPGGNYVYTINYHNHGDKLATGVVITDSLPTGLTYITDTSGLPHTTAGNSVAWDVGSLDAHTDRSFDVYVAVSGALAPGARITNEVQIATPDYDSNSDNNRHTWWTDLIANETRLNLGKGAWTGDPAAGYDLVFNVNVCNNGGTGSSAATLTDTLHPSMTLQYWWGQHPGWTQVFSDAHSLVLSRPSIPGWWCGEVYVRARVDAAAWPGLSIFNTATVAAGNDTDGSDNNTQTWWGNVNRPHTNLNIDKWWSWGQLTPGGEIRYYVNYNNNGNLPVTTAIRITDTLPVSTTFIAAWRYDQSGQHPFTPVYTGVEYVVWEIGGLDNGYSDGFEVALAVDGNAHPGAVLTNTVQISPQPEEDRYDDNAATVVETLYGSGPNLRVRKWHEEWRWNDNRELNYQVTFENVGDQPVSNVWLTDTRPSATTFGPGGSCWPRDNWGQWVADGGRLVATTESGLARAWQFDRLGPGESGWFWCWVNLDDPNARPRWYTNTVEIAPRAGDISLSDNLYSDVAVNREVEQVELWLDSDNGNVWGRAQPGAAVTVTTPYVQRVTWADPGCGGCWDIGSLGPVGPINPGNLVVVKAGSGQLPVTILAPDPFDAHVSSITDTIWGRIDALDHQMVEVDLYGHGVKTVPTDGSGNYSAVFSDVPPGGNGEVRYHTEIDYADVIFHRGFREPAADVAVDKYGQAQPAPGGNYVYTINYHNYGDKLATGVVITDSLPTGLAYITDTSGLPHTTAGNSVAWDVGNLDAYTDRSFDVYVAVSGTLAPGARITNEVQIVTSECDSNPDNNRHEWPTEVVPNDARLNVSKNAWTGDPTPGYDFVWAVNVCNNGSTASSELVLTDTLPVSTTLVGWWGQHPGWSERLADGARLVVSRPSIPGGGWCSEVYLRLHLDENAPLYTWISNTATITAANDIGDNNTAINWVWVRDPHINLNIDKQWNWGQLTPGGEIRYNVNYRNNGNLPVTTTIRITDTLPVSTTFVAAWRYDQSGPHPVTPVYTGAEYVVWEIGGLDNGYWGGFEVVLNVDGNARPGTVLTNTAQISRLPVEDSYDDNVSAWVETLLDHGPNLRVRKWGGWHGDRAGHAWYQFIVENIGDVQVPLAVVTDTYPLSMTIEGNPWTDWGRVAGYASNDAEHWFSAVLQNVHPGYRLDFGFNAAIAEPVPFGLILTNTARVTLYLTETNLADNSDDLVLATGPNLYVDKTLVAGEPLPGELITFNLRFGNDQPGHTWWWTMQGNAWLTDTLPAGLVYVTSTQHWCGWTEWCFISPTIRGGDYVWPLWPLGAGEWNEIRLTARVADTVTGQDTLTNTAEIASDRPDADVEPYYDDNADSYTLEVPLPYFQVSKVYESSRVAGTAVTYRLSVANRGREAGTNVVLSDTLPAGLTYGGGDGVRVGGAVRWTFGALAAHTGTGAGWFSGTLPCAGTVTNHDYRVVSSAEGVTGPSGPAVSFSVRPPTITVGLAHTPATIIAGDTVYFTATASTNGRPPLSYQWNLGAGPVSGGLTASHVYTRHGSYTVAFTATDGCAYTGVARQVVRVSAPALVADFDQSATLIAVNNTVRFTDTSTTNGPGITRWQWSFGDGGTSAVQHPTHAYTRTGVFTVSLLVADSLGYTATHTVPGAVTVQAGCTAVTGLGFVYSPTPAVIGQATTFTATYTAGLPAPTFVWRLDGGAPLSGQSIVHTFTTTGTHTVAVTATNACGSLPYSRTIRVEPRRIYLPIVLR